MGLKLNEVKSAAELDRFIRLPWKIYKDYPFWVPPLISERKKFLNPQINPFFDNAEVRLFLVEDDKNNTLGRIALVHDHAYQKNYSKSTGIMGMFETVDDENVSRFLFDHAKEWCKNLAKKGIFVGQSSGANLAGISEVIKNLSDGVIVTLLNDFGDRYFSTGLWS